MRHPTNTTGPQKIKLDCIDNGKTIEVEFYELRGEKLTVILPGFQKMILTKVQGKPGLYIANQFGMEYHARYTR